MVRKNSDWVALFSFEGVMARGPFFIYYVPILMVSVVLAIVANVWIVLAVFGWPMVALKAKRLHDWNRSGWMQLIYNLLDGITLIGGTLVIGLMSSVTENNRFLGHDIGLAKTSDNEQRKGFN